VLDYGYHPEAEAEYHADVRYYRDISPNLGRAFVIEVEAAIKRILEFPEAYSPAGKGLRRCPVRRFRHIIVYEIQSERVFIWAVAHTSREPGYWKTRREK
jgi:plasmid stabilization system protein ParE